MGMGYEQHGWPVSTCSRPFWEDLLKPEALSQPVSGGYLIRSHPRPWEQGVAGRLTVSDPGGEQDCACSFLCPPTIKLRSQAGPASQWCCKNSAECSKAQRMGWWTARTMDHPKLAAVPATGTPPLGLLPHQWQHPPALMPHRT